MVDTHEARHVIPLALGELGFPAFIRGIGTLGHQGASEQGTQGLVQVYHQAVNTGQLALGFSHNAPVFMPEIINRLLKKPVKRLFQYPA
jgi:hypothetical protein